MFLVLEVESLIVSEWSATEQGFVSIGGPLMLWRWGQSARHKMK